MISAELLNTKLKEQFPELDFEITEFRNELTISSPSSSIVDLCKYLKTEPELEYLLCEDITAIDWATRKDRFTIVYHIYSLINNSRLSMNGKHSICMVLNLTGIRIYVECICRKILNITRYEKTFH
jgi:NADH:ubiquinone oxidoreductase subunit C